MTKFNRGSTFATPKFLIMNITEDMNAMDRIAQLKQEQAEATDFETKMFLMDQILKIEREAGFIKGPDSSNFECHGCGS